MDVLTQIIHAVLKIAEMSYVFGGSPTLYWLDGDEFLGCLG